MSIADLTEDHRFAELVTQPSFQRPILLKFYGPNCAPCHALAPHLHALDAQQPGLTIVAVDTSKAPGVTQQFAIRTVPTLIMVRNGQAVARHDGSPGGPGPLAQFVQPHLG